MEDYDRYIRPMEDRIIRSIWRIVQDPHDAEDALQDVLAAIWERRERVFKHANPTALILRMCTNSAYDVVRRRLKDKRLTSAAARQADAERPDGSPLTALVHRERHDQLLQAIGRLSRKQAQAVLMRLVEQMSYSEIAAALQCSEGTARVHVQRGRHQLRRRLAKTGPEAVR